jgi:hypothetical protein
MEVPFEVIDKASGDLLPHKFAPARFILIHSMLSHQQIINNRNAYNSYINRWGEECKILVGSRKIREGIDFKDILHQIILSLPNNILMLNQLFGRSVRNYSHINLPEAYRKVMVYILTNTFADGSMGPELLDYKNKVDDFIKVREIDKIFNEVAIDGYILNTAERLAKSQNADSAGSSELENIGPSKFDNSADYIKYKNVPINNTMYLALDSYHEELDTTKYLLKRAFMFSNVWKIDELWEYIKQQPSTPNAANFDYKYFLVALDTYNNVIIRGDYVLYNIDDIMAFDKKQNEIFSYKFTHFSLSKDKSLEDEIIALKQVVKQFTLLNSYHLYEKYLIDIHIELMRNSFANPMPIIIEFYSNIFTYFSAKDLAITNDTAPIGYFHIGHINYYFNNSWNEQNYTITYNENNILIGKYVEDMKFKLRPPNSGIDVKDARKRLDGIVCKSINKQNIMVYVKKLSIKLPSSGERIHDVCQMIKHELIRRESIKMNKLKWVYLN